MKMQVEVQDVLKHQEHHQEQRVDHPMAHMQKVKLPLGRQPVHWHSRCMRWLAVVFLALTSSYWLLVAGFSAFTSDNGSDYDIDFPIYYAAARALRHNSAATIYTWQTLARSMPDPARGGCPLAPHVPYIYPPLLAIVLEPLTLLPCATASRVWHIGSVALWGIATALLVLQLRRSWPRQPLLAAGLAIGGSALCFPLLDGLWLGQVTAILLCAFVCVPWLVRREQHWLAGAVLAFVACVKLFPAILILYYLARGRWRIVSGAVIAGAVMAALMLLVVGSSGVLGMRTIPVTFESAQNVSLVTLPVIGWPLALAIGCAWAAGLWGMRGRSDDTLGYAWSICTMLLTSPLIWFNYLAWLLPVFAICLGAIPPRRRTCPLLVALALLYALTMAPRLLLEPRLGIVGLWLLTGALFLRSGHAAQRESPQPLTRHEPPPAEATASPAVDLLA